MSKIIPDVALLTGITVDDRLEDKSDAISNAISEDREVKKRVRILLNNVPFRFQKPWIDTTDDSEMQRRSKSFENDCLYSLTGSGEGLTVTINPRWSSYLTTNYEVLRDLLCGTSRCSCSRRIPTSRTYPASCFVQKNGRR